MYTMYVPIPWLVVHLFHPADLPDAIFWVVVPHSGKNISYFIPRSLLEASCLKNARIKRHFVGDSAWRFIVIQHFLPYHLRRIKYEIFLTLWGTTTQKMACGRSAGWNKCTTSHGIGTYIVYIYLYIYIYIYIYI
jgi:hypothetical protein